MVGFLTHLKKCFCFFEKPIELKKTGPHRRAFTLFLKGGRVFCDLKNQISESEIKVVYTFQDLITLMALSGIALADYRFCRKIIYMQYTVPSVRRDTFF